MKRVSKNILNKITHGGSSKRMVKGKKEEAIEQVRKMRNMKKVKLRVWVNRKTIEQCEEASSTLTWM